MAWLPAIVFGQPVTGTVTDTSGSPVSNASVSVDKRLRAYTDASGKFSIAEPSTGQTIRISHIAFKPFEIVYDGTTKHLNVVLQRESYPTEEVVISATRASHQTATAFTDLDRETIEKINYGKDIPFLMEMTPSATATSDAGHGIGYTGVWIRGTDPSRINVTINGIPVNDPESQLVFWVDLPDLASSAHNIQIQRGAGTSTHGAGAFGGSIHIQTNKLNELPYATVQSSVGSFGSFKNTLTGGTGLINNRFTFDVRLSAIRSDGYIDRGRADLKSFFLSHGYYGKKSTARLNIFTGKEITYQCWYGTPEARIKNDTQGMIDYVIRNGLDSEDSLNLLTAGRTYNFYTYDNQVDDYRQDYYHLHLAHQFTPRWQATAALHYTRGKGFFEEYKKSQKLSNYGITDSLAQQLGRVNLIRRKWLDNDFYGMIFALHYLPGSAWTVTVGGAWNQYINDHFGEVLWATYLPVKTIPHQYYFNTGFKTDFNSYLKTIWSRGMVSLYGDVQWRRISYYFSVPDADDNRIPDHDEVRFFNPKAGITLTPAKGQRFYASVARAGKEPSRKDYIDNPRNQRPLPERMTDFEFGYEYLNSFYSAAINLYHMQYSNQLVLNGSVNDVGEPVRINVKDSYRQGIELMLSANPLKWLLTSANLTVSRNRIRSYYEIIPDYDDYSNDTLLFDNTPISFSPEVIAAGNAEFRILKNLQAGLQFKYTGKQYLDNTGSDSKKLNAYHFFNAYAGWQIRISKKHELELRAMVYNLTDRLYETNGYTYSYIYAGNTITENFYYPQAGRHFMFGAGFKF